MRINVRVFFQKKVTITYKSRGGSSLKKPAFISLNLSKNMNKNMIVFY